MFIESNNFPRFESNTLPQIQLTFYPDGKVMARKVGPALLTDDYMGDDLPEGFEDFKAEFDGTEMIIEALFPDLEEVICWLEDLRDKMDEETLLSTFAS